jgi:hypothetical protein
MKVIKIVIDDEEEKALSPEAEELLRRRAAEVGFSTLDWIVQLLNSTRNKTTKTNRKTRTRRRSTGWHLTFKRELHGNFIGPGLEDGSTVAKNAI